MAGIENSAEILLHKMKTCFYKGSYNFELESAEIDVMTWDWQQLFLNLTLNSPLVQKYPVSKNFTKLFLKRIINYLEGKQEVHEELYIGLCLAINTRDDEFCHRHYLINNGSEVITIKETNKMVVNGTTGMKTWEAALMLADWALCYKENFNNRIILELGSGVGFTGITIAKLCNPNTIYLTDCHPDVMKAITDNIRINFPDFKECEDDNSILFQNAGRSIGAMPLDWNRIEELPENIKPDVVIGADIVYDPSILQPLCDVFSTLFKRNEHLKIYIASVIRNHMTFDLFLKCLENMKLCYQEVNLNECVHIEWDHSIQKCLLQITQSK